ncbi:MAG: hypothetical protein ACOX2B_01100 [Syntrophothermaceae bacterium]
MLHLFKKAAVVGLEIDAGEVRAVELQGSSGGPHSDCLGYFVAAPCGGSRRGDAA